MSGSTSFDRDTDTFSHQHMNGGTHYLAQNGQAATTLLHHDIEAEPSSRPTPAPRKRGRPRKYPVPVAKNDIVEIKRPRGRPKGSGKHQRAAAAAAAAAAVAGAASIQASVDSTLPGPHHVGNGLANHIAPANKHDPSAPQNLADAVATPNLPATVSPPLFETPSTNLRNRRKKATPTKAA